MLKLDEFESAFKSADKARYEHRSIAIEHALVFTDLEQEAARRFAADVAEFSSALDGLRVTSVHGGEYTDAGELLAIVEREHPDLIVAYRNLHGRAQHYPFSLGSHVDVLTQATTTPVLLLPPPREDDRLDTPSANTKNVMVLNDHLTGSDPLVHYGVAFTAPGGRLVLTHLEDDAVFERYMNVIAKVQTIDTETARRDIQKQLLKEPRDYIGSIRRELEALGLQIDISEVVTMGHHIADIRRLASEHALDLLVMNTKDDEQLAMHGLAYPIAVELRSLPLLLL